MVTDDNVTAADQLMSSTGHIYEVDNCSTRHANDMSKLIQCDLSTQCQARTYVRVIRIKDFYHSIT